MISSSSREPSPDRYSSMETNIQPKQNSNIDSSSLEDMISTFASRNLTPELSLFQTQPLVDSSKILSLHLDNGLGLNFTNRFGQSLLHLMAYEGQVASAKLLLKKGILIEVQDSSQQTPLFLASAQGHSHVVEYFLKKGANPNSLDLSGNTPLHFAAKHGHISTAEILIKAGAKLDIANKNHDLPFDLAIRSGQDAFFYFFLGIKTQVDDGKLPKDIEGYYSKQLLIAKRENHVHAQVFNLIKLSEIYLQKNNWTQTTRILNGALAILEKNLDNPSFKIYLLARLERLEAQFLEHKGIKVSSYHKGSVSKYRSALKEIRLLNAQKFHEGLPIQNVLFSLTQSYKKLLADLLMESQKILGPPPTRWACVGMGSMARNEMCPYSDLEFAFLIEKKTEEALIYFRLLSQLLELRIINCGETKFPMFAQIFGQGSAESSPTPGGFSQDSGGNTPLGKPGFYELIDTPEGLAQFQSHEWIDGDIIVMNALSSVTYVAGEATLVSTYDQAKQKSLITQKLALKLLEGNLQEFEPELSKEKQEISAFGIKKEFYRPIQSLLGSLKLFCGLNSISSYEMIHELLEKGILSYAGAKNLKKALQLTFCLRFEAHNFYQNEEEFLFQIVKGKPLEANLLYLTDKYLKDLHEIYMVLIPLHQCAKEFFRTENIEVFMNTALYEDNPQAQGKIFEKTLEYDKALEAYQQALSLNPQNDYAQIRLEVISKNKFSAEHKLSTNLIELESAQKKYGENHPEVALCYSNIGRAYNKLGNNEKALEFCEKALKIRIDLFGEEQFGVVNSYLDLATIYISMGRYEVANEFYNKGNMCILNQKNSFLEEMKNDKTSEINKNYMSECIEFCDSVSRRYNLPNATYVASEDDKTLENYQEALQESIHNLSEQHPDVALRYDDIGSVYTDRENYSEAIKFYQKALDIRILAFGRKHDDVAKSYVKIGYAHRMLGEYEAALTNYQNALESRLQIFGGNHPSVALCYSDIGLVFSRLKKHESALKYHHMALEINRQSRVINLEVAKNYENIGDDYLELGHKDQALDQYHEALKIKHSFFRDNNERIGLRGEQHSSLASCYLKIGTAHESFKEFEKALDFYLKGLEAYSYSHSQDHYLAHFYSPIARTYSMLNKWDKALEFYQKVLEIERYLLGDRHPDLTTTYDDIAKAHSSLGAYDQALHFYQQSFAINLHTLGNQHLKTANNYHNIGLAYLHLKEYHEALKFFQNALEIWLPVLDDQKQNVATTYTYMGKAHSSLEEYETGLEYYQMGAQITRQILDDKDDNLVGWYTLAGCYSCIASACIALGNQETALEFFNKTLDIFKKQGADPIGIASLYSTIGHLHRHLKRYENALQMHQEALVIELHNLGDQDMAVAISYGSIADLYKTLCEPHKSLEAYQSALKIWLLFQDNEQYLLSCYKNIGDLCSQFKMYNEALEAYNNAYQMKCTLFTYQFEHPEVLLSINDLGKTYNKLGQYENALEILQENLETQRLSLGDQHLDIARTYSYLADVHVNLKDTGTALSFYQKSLDILLSLNPTDPEIVILKSNIAEMEKIVSSNTKSHKIVSATERTALISQAPNNINVSINTKAGPSQKFKEEDPCCSIF